MADDQDFAEGSVAQTTEPAVAPSPRTRWRDRAWSFRAMLAVAAASLVIGGVAGGAIGAATGGDHDHGRYRTGPWGPGKHMGPGWRNGGPGFNGPGGPQWRWNNGQQPGQPPTPYGTPTPSAPATPSTPGATG